VNNNTTEEFDDLLNDGLGAARALVWWVVVPIVFGLLAWWALA
jgi:hypothetical protein